MICNSYVSIVDDILILGVRDFKRLHIWSDFQSL